MNISNFIPYTGIFLYPIMMLLFKLVVVGVAKDFTISPTVQFICIYIAPLVFPAIVTTTNMERQKRGQTDFSFAAVYGLGKKDPKQSKEYFDAAYPEIPANYSSKIPQGLVLGRHKGRYVYCPVEKDGINVFGVGTPGSGKSVLLLGWLYSMIHREKIAKKGGVKPSRSYNFFMVDIKGELFEKLLQIDAKDYTAREYADFQVVQPSNRHSYGWDVFYRVRGDDVNETEIIKTAYDIADAMVVSSGDDLYFSDNAKKILSGVLYYYIKKGEEFLPIIQRLMRTNLDELLTEIVADAEELRWGVVLDKLKGFVGKDDNESVADIETTLKTYLEVFSYPDIQWCVHDNPNKTSPSVLDDGKTNLDFAIPESMLGVYQPIFRLVSMQVLRHCESAFHESDDRYTMLLFDEAARIGNISGLDSAMATLRSKHVALICLFQSISQFKDIYPSEKANTLLNLCELKIFLSGSGDEDTTKYISGMVGQFDATKMSYKYGMFGKRDSNYSDERRDVVEAKDLMELREKGECIAFIYGHYVRCKKLRYFEDAYLSSALKNKNSK